MDNVLKGQDAPSAGVSHYDQRVLRMLASRVEVHESEFKNHPMVVGRLKIMVLGGLVNYVWDSERQCRLLVIADAGRLRSE